jgi:hypothetical protein
MLDENQLLMKSARVIDLCCLADTICLSSDILGDIHSLVKILENITDYKIFEQIPKPYSGKI